MSQALPPFTISPEFAPEAAGLGFVARTTGAPGHDIIRLALELLAGLEHRSHLGTAGQSGAGLLIHLPHALLAAEIPDLPAPGDYAVGTVFLPRTNITGAVNLTEKILGQVLTQALPSAPVRPNGGAAALTFQLAPVDPARFLHWRAVPINPILLGEAAAKTCPEIRQIIIRRPAGIAPGETFERLMFAARQKLVTAIRNVGMKGFFIPSLSTHTVVYKGLVRPSLLADFYPDLTRPACQSALAVVHTGHRTHLTWADVQPMRLLAHHGYLNTIQGNQNWLRARESTLDSPYWAEGIRELHPLVEPQGSAAAHLNNALELLTRSGRDIHHAMAMLVPEAWESLMDIPPDRRAFYRYHAALMEPWDGPAALIFTDGRRVGAALDRNGLRPLRYLTTSTHLVIAASEAGMVKVDEGVITTKSKLGPGQMILVDLPRQIFLSNDQVKNELARRSHYQTWVTGFKPLTTETRPARFNATPPPRYQPPPKVTTNPQWLTRFQAAFGYTTEEITLILRPMAQSGKEPIGAMGDDTALAALSEWPRPLFHYFKQHFAQVSSPPIDPLRETLVMSLTTRLGARPNLLAESARHAHLIELSSPVLTDLDLENLKLMDDPRFQSQTLAARYPAEQGGEGLRRAITRLCTLAERAIDHGKTILILSDHGVDHRHAPIPALLAVGAVHQHLLRQGRRMLVSLVAESGEVREVHHLACLLAFGANAVNPYLALATVEGLVETGKVRLSLGEARRNTIRALEAGLLKIMAKMGVSTVESYAGAQLMEAIGLGPTLVNEFFGGVISRLGRVELADIAAVVAHWHRAAFTPPDKPALHNPGLYKFTRHGEAHAYAPVAVQSLQQAVRLAGALSPAASQPAPLDGVVRAFPGPHFAAGYAAYRQFTAALRQNHPIAPRDLLDFGDSPRPPLEVAEVEPLEAILAHFAVAAMSLGAVSQEAHENLAIAANRLGIASNTGEGGAERTHFGTERDDRIKQVASGRFGLTPAYLMAAGQLQIKMAQGAKPGEGGHLPGAKVTAEISALRHTPVGATLISPPPQHDVYGLEDLAQLIYDLKQVNPQAEVAVKLVSEAGVGAVAAGAVMAGAEAVHLSGHAGGTGAAAWSSIKYAGLPLELGLAEIRHSLPPGQLRQGVRLSVDGGLQTGRDVVMAAMLGADEFHFGAATLIASGCLMTRGCHRNTCPAGIATQNPALRAKFAGQPEHVMAYLHYVAQEVREILAQLGYRRLSEVIGRAELLTPWAADWPDVSPLLAPAAGEGLGQPGAAQAETGVTVNELNALLLAQAEPALRDGQPVQLNLPIGPTDRAVGATLSGAIAQQYGDLGLPDGTIAITFHGSAGQSFGAFNASGLNLTLIGEANDFVGKGMNGGQIVIRPPLKSPRVACDHTIIGNTGLYGATGGSLFIAGQAGERFAVRNSGATAVVDGLGDHGCEYMTGGVVIVLGRTGHNFGAGLSGGMAFVLDESHSLTQRINPDMVEMVRLTNQNDIGLLRLLITRHARLTGSERARFVLEHWSSQLGAFWKVAPKGTVGSTGVRPATQVTLPTLELSQHVVG